jgi:hypothetical protein
VQVLVVCEAIRRKGGSLEAKLYFFSLFFFFFFLNYKNQ